MIIEENDRREWADHPVTIELVSKLKEYRAHVLEIIASGSINEHPKLERHIGRSIAALTFIQAIEDLKIPKEERFEEVKDAQ